MNHPPGRSLPLLSLSSLLVALATLPAQDWPNWRGPSHNGSSPCKGLPAKFGQSENRRWATELPGPGANTPIVLGDRVFLSAVDTAKDRLVAMCLDRRDGKVLWQKAAGSGYRPGGTGTDTSRKLGPTNYAAPSPVCDGDTVVFFFGNGDLVGFDLAGKRRWRRNVQQDYGDFSFQWTFSASPTMWAGGLYLPVLQRDTKTHKLGGLPGAAGGTQAAAPIESFLLCLDPKTGKTRYRHQRPSKARMESLESYTTMIPYVGVDGRQQLLLAGGDVLTAHDPATGAELWRWGTWNEGHRERWWRLVPSVVVGGGVALVCAPKRQPVYAIRLAANQGELDQKSLLWKSGGRPNKVSSDVPTPAFDGRHFFVLSDVRPSLSKLEPKTGKILWTTDLPKILWRASPTVADGRVYIMSHHGDVVVFEAKTGKIVHYVKMGKDGDDHIRSSVVVAHQSLFIRTNDKLFCIGAPARPAEPGQPRKSGR